MSGETFPYDVFLSYSAKDKAVVRPLAERSRACRAVACGRRRMLCMSAHAFGSDWAQLACPAVAPERRRKAGTFRFRDPLNSAFAKRLRTDRQERRFIPPAARRRNRRRTEQTQLRFRLDPVIL